MKQTPVIMQIAGSLGIGGAEEVAMLLAQAVHAAGWQSIYVAATNDRNRDAFRKRLREQGVLVLELAGGLQSKCRVVGRLALMTRPDVIHVHTELPELLGLVGKYAAPGARLVRTVHNSAHWPEHPFVRYSVNRLYRVWGSHQYACSPEVARPGDEVIINGIPWSSALSSKHNGEVVFVGRMERQKHPDKLIQIVREARRSHPHIELTMVGDGRLKPALMRRFPQPWIHWPGAVDDARPFLARAQVTVFASAYEGLPLVALEALTTLTWVLAPDISGFHRLPWAECYPPSDTMTAAKTLIHLMKQDSRNKLYAMRGMYREEFSEEIMTARYIASYQALLANRTSQNVVGG